MIVNVPVPSLSVLTRVLDQLHADKVDHASRIASSKAFVAQTLKAAQKKLIELIQGAIKEANTNGNQKTRIGEEIEGQRGEEKDTAKQRCTPNR